MTKVRFAASLIGIALFAGAAQAASPNGPDHEAVLGQQMQQALWPADIVRLADDYLRKYPNGPMAGSARSLRDQATVAVGVLKRNDVRLYRSSFQPHSDTAGQQDELRRAALGDKEAAARLAHMNQQSEGAGSNESGRYIGWLQYAALLGHPKASYELSVYFRREAQPAMASVYEARAVELGYTLPRDLDHFRK
jgi:TPR repeat protein